MLQSSVKLSGGLTEAKKIATLAQAKYLPICPHNPIGPVANAMTLHLAAAAGNFAWLETMMSDVPWRGEVVHENVDFVDGMMTIPKGPGLGIEIDEEACGRYPYRPYELRHYKGSLTDIRPPNATPFYKVTADEGAA